MWTCWPRHPCSHKYGDTYVNVQQYKGWRELTLTQQAGQGKAKLGENASVPFNETSTGSIAPCVSFDCSVVAFMAPLKILAESIPQIPRNNQLGAAGHRANRRSYLSSRSRTLVLAVIFGVVLTSLRRHRRMTLRPPNTAVAR